MYLIPQPLVLAPPRDDGLLYALYVDGEEILHFVQNDIAYNLSRHCEELHAKAFVIPLTVYAIPWQSTIDYSALLILTQVALHRH